MSADTLNSFYDVLDKLSPEQLAQISEEIGGNLSSGSNELQFRRKRTREERLDFYERVFIQPARRDPVEEMKNRIITNIKKPKRAGTFTGEVKNDQAKRDRQLAATMRYNMRKQDAANRLSRQFSEAKEVLTKYRNYFQSARLPEPFEYPTILTQQISCHFRKVKELANQLCVAVNLLKQYRDYFRNAKLEAPIEFPTWIDSELF